MSTTTNAKNWCPSCEDVCNDHKRICTICGSNLEHRPSPPAANSGDTGTGTSTRQQTVGGDDDVVVNNNNNLMNIAVDAQGWQSIPDELLAPQHMAGSSSVRATGKETLAKLPRIVLTTQSSLFYSSTIQVQVVQQVQQSEAAKAQTQVICDEEMEAIPGEFGPTIKNFFHLENANLIIPDKPRTGKDGKMICTTNTSNNNSNNNNVVLLERGDGVTFVQKSVLAIQTFDNVKGIIVINNMDEPWPYIMKDSKGEAIKHNLQVPVVMISKQNGKKILNMHHNNHQLNSNIKLKSFHIKSTTTSNNNNECIVCKDVFEIGQTLLKLPICGHFFHEECAMMWLTKHNTCPTCRFELPTDDEDYEYDRRRRLQQRGGGGVGSSENNWNHYYG